jgi:hypothetical protein
MYSSPRVQSSVWTPARRKSCWLADHDPSGGGIGLPSGLQSAMFRLSYPKEGGVEVVQKARSAYSTGG